MVNLPLAHTIKNKMNDAWYKYRQADVNEIAVIDTFSVD